MLKNIYDRMITNIAGQQTVSKVSIPLTELGIGEAEILNPIIHPYNINRVNPASYMMVETPQIRMVDNTLNVGRGAQVTPEDFIYTGYTGEAL